MIAVAVDTVQVQQIARGGLPTLTQLLEAGAPRIALTMIAVGGLVWLIAYVAAIRVGFRERVVTLPVVAICLNITWEIVHSLVYTPPRLIDFITNLAWLGLDLVLLYQVFRFGRKEQAIPELARYFPLVVAGTLVLAFAGHITFHQHVTANAIFPDESGAIPAFIINLVMSVLFVAMYFERKDGAGLSKTVAWGKFIGSSLYAVGNTLVLIRIPDVEYQVQVQAPGSLTWAPAGVVGGATIHPGLLYFLFIGIAIFDVIYLVLLYRGPGSARRAGSGP